jgi:hypothetical protein
VIPRLTFRKSDRVKQFHKGYILSWDGYQRGVEEERMSESG